MNGSVCLAQVHSPTTARPDRNDLPVVARREHGAIPLRRAVLRRLEHRVRARSGKKQSAAGEQNSLTVGEPTSIGNPFNYSPTGIPNSFAITRQFSTGGELLVGFANSFVWQFAGHDSNIAIVAD